MGSLPSQPRYFLFCSGEPASLSGVIPSVLAVKLVWMPEQPYASSSVTNDESRSDNPGPPYSLGKVVLTRPSFQASSKSSRGNVASRSQRAAMGMMRSLAKRRAVSMRAFCSSVISKSIMEPHLPRLGRRPRLLAHTSPPLVYLGSSGATADD